MSFEIFYSEIYDAVHHDKRYDLEAEQISTFIREKCNAGARVLDFGCGTGKHARLLRESGIDISGYDPNVNMIRVARTKNQNIPFSDEKSYISGNFDFVYSLFDVLSYQISDLDVVSFLANVHSMVKSTGWVLLDGWHLPAMENNPPESRAKLFTYNGVNYIRDVKVIDINPNGVTSLDISIKEVGSETIEHNEIHRLRGFNKNQIIDFINDVGGHNINFHNGYNYAEPLEDLDWRFAVSFQL